MNDRWSDTEYLRYLARFGTSAQKTTHDRAHSVWSNASPYDKAKTQAALETVRETINTYTQENIAPKAFWWDWSYSVSGRAVGDAESSLTIRISPEFGSRAFRRFDIGDTLLSLPAGATATVNANRWGIDVTIRGHTNIIRDMDENQNNYRARIYFTNLRAGDWTSYSVISAELLKIEVLKVQ